MVLPRPIDCEALRRRLQQASRRGTEQRRLHQHYCVYLVALGHSCRDVASWFGDSARSVERWVLTHTLDPGPAASARGRPARLDAAQRRQLYLDLARPPPLPGRGEPRWDGRLLQRHLQSRYAVGLSLRQCQRALLAYRQTLAKSPPAF